MNLQVLVVSKDDNASDVLSRALAGFGVGVERFSDPEVAQARLGEQRFDGLVVDFDDPGVAEALLKAGAAVSAGRILVTIALAADASKVREVLKTGAKFVLYKPLSLEQATATLRAATSLLKRERRSAIRVPVQAPVQLSIAGSEPLEGILLDLSQDGMDVLAAQPLEATSLVGLRFTLPDGSLEIDAHGEVAWANPNGQSGVHFLDVPPDVSEKLKAWLLANAPEILPEDADPVAQCKLTDLSLGGCYIETASPFPEQALVDLGLKAADMEIHIEGVVRVMHPSTGMGVEFPSRTEAQREAVTNFIQFLTGRPGTTPELFVSPQSSSADEAQFHSDIPEEDRLEDPLLELLRKAHQLSYEEFTAELHSQRNPEAVAAP
jgi:CheY-like chemotaxis protein/c-di-GMP-binding flagellar brake protein YcgR